MLDVDIDVMSLVGRGYQLWTEPYTCQLGM